MKPKTNIKKYRKDIIYTLVIANLIIWFCAYTTASRFYSHYVEVVTAYISEPIQPARAEVKPEPVKKELSIEEYIKAETTKAGLNWSEVRCLLDHENKSLNPYALYDNPNNAGVDRGIFMFSSIWHKEISNQEAFDYKKATAHFIRIAKADGNFNQWHGFKMCQ